ncbi:MAG TPA: hypothetical protein VGD74_07625, partial [Vulgatibacter sp.]
MRVFLWNAAKAAIDLAALGCAVVLSVVLCSGDRSGVAWRNLLVGALPIAVAVQVGTLTLFGVLRCPWRYVGFREVVQLVAALATATLLLTAAWALSLWGGDSEGLLLSPDALIAGFAMSVVALAGLRGTRRLFYERVDRARRTGSPLVPTMLVGADLVGVMVAKEIGNRPDLGIEPVGFLDDDPMKQGQTVHGVPVRGRIADLLPLCREHGARQVLITDSRLARRNIRRIAQLCEKEGLEAKIVPGIFEIVGWRSNLSRIRKVAIEDLLGRDPVVLDDEAIAEDLRDRVVLVTGGRRQHRLRALQADRPDRPEHARPRRAGGGEPLPHPPRAGRVVPLAADRALHRRRLRRDPARLDLPS